MMHRLRIQIQILTTKYAYGPDICLPLPKRIQIVEEELWGIVEQAMKVQQEICGGHK